jgi:hypothetical protein
MKRITLIILSGALVYGAFLLYSSCLSTSCDLLPEATEVGSEEDGENKEKREAWFERMHYADAETDWRAIEYQNHMRFHKENAERRKSVSNRSGLIEIAGGKLVGEWRERGSQNQAGSVFDVEYDTETDEIWMISAGGTLFKGPRSGNNWQVIMQDLQLNPGLLKFVDVDSGRRLLAFSGRIPHYSDDEGLTWNASTGIPVADLRWASFRSPVVLDDSLHTFYVISKPDYWTPAKIYKSVDKGETFEAIRTLPTHEMDRYALCNPHHSNELYFIEKRNAETIFYKVNPTTDEFEELSRNSDWGFGDARANLAGIQIDTTVRWITYAEEDGDDYAFKSEDFGNSWTRMGLLEERPWEVGIYISPSNPEFILTGGVHCLYSINGGQTWSRRNDWWAYYDNVESALHADMMSFTEFETANGTVFTLIGNHGGLNISYNRLQTIQNLGLTSLNVSQYYSVRTDPIDPFYIYAGSQDQGFQVANSFGQENGIDFDQVISGDYGHTVFSRNGRHLWTVYPGGSVSFYAVPSTGQRTTGWEVDSENESVWIPPLMESPDQSQNVVYMAGGSVDGGPGSYLIRLEYAFGNIDATQLPFNFRAEAGGDGELSAISFSKANPSRWYGATTNGRFFYSDDAGQNWNQTVNFIPSGHYLYGQSIVASSIDSNLVFLGGSGYSNPPVYRSKDGGKTFQAMDEGLPNTLVFGMTLDPEEKFLFAGTETGPFVYVFEDEMWYPMAEGDAPLQSYWSVEYEPIFNVVRFGTYGRGIWDFEVKDVVKVKEEGEEPFDFTIFPNPGTGSFALHGLPIGSENKEITIWNNRGRLVKKIKGSQNTFDLSGNQPGLYLVRINDGKNSALKKLILTN